MLSSMISLILPNMFFPQWLAGRVLRPHSWPEVIYNDTAGAFCVNDANAKQTTNPKLKPFTDGHDFFAKQASKHECLNKKGVGGIGEAIK